LASVTDSTAYAAGARSRPLSPELTEREQEVLELIAAGKNNPEIAAKLCLSIDTVKTHVRRIMGKLGGRNRARLVDLGWRHGLLPMTKGGQLHGPLT
jgi:DNA-binding NarL/FixJ family response regulator